MLLAAECGVVGDFEGGWKQCKKREKERTRPEVSRGNAQGTSYSQTPEIYRTGATVEQGDNVELNAQQLK